jgi:hypothetical protein
MLHRVDADQRQSKVREVLEDPVQLGLVTDGADEQSVPAGMARRQALERGDRVIAELSFDFQPIGSACHGQTVTREGGDDSLLTSNHLGDSTSAKEVRRLSPIRPSAVARATASVRELTASLR